MRHIFAIPLTAIVISLFVLLAFAGAEIEPESLVYDTVLPSTAEFFLKAGEFLTAGGILLLTLSAWRALKCPAIAPTAAVLCSLMAVTAIILFIVAPFAGSTTFFFLMLLAIAEAAIAIIAWLRARRAGV